MSAIQQMLAAFGASAASGMGLPAGATEIRVHQINADGTSATGVRIDGGTVSLWKWTLADGHSAANGNGNYYGDSGRSAVLTLGCDFGVSNSEFAVWDGTNFRTFTAQTGQANQYIVKMSANCDHAVIYGQTSGTYRVYSGLLTFAATGTGLTYRTLVIPSGYNLLGVASVTDGGVVYGQARTTGSVWRVFRCPFANTTPTIVYSSFVTGYSLSSMFGSNDGSDVVAFIAAKASSPQKLYTYSAANGLTDTTITTATDDEITLRRLTSSPEVLCLGLFETFNGVSAPKRWKRGTGWTNYAQISGAFAESWLLAYNDSTGVSIVYGTPNLDAGPALYRLYRHTSGGGYVELPVPDGAGSSNTVGEVVVAGDCATLYFDCEESPGGSAGYSSWWTLADGLTSLGAWS